MVHNILIQIGIVKIIDNGASAKGTFIVMQKLGPSLKELIQLNHKVFRMRSVCQIGI